MRSRKASIKESGEEISREEWARFDAAVAEVRGERNEIALHGSRKPAPIDPRSLTPPFEKAR